MDISNIPHGRATVESAGGRADSDVAGSAGRVGDEPPIMHIGNYDNGGQISKSAGTDPPPAPGDDIMVRLTISLPQHRLEDLFYSTPRFANLIETEIREGDEWCPYNVP